MAQWSVQESEQCSMLMMTGRVSTTPGGPQLTTGLSSVWHPARGSLRRQECGHGVTGSVHTPKSCSTCWVKGQKLRWHKASVPAKHLTLNISQLFCYVEYFLFPFKAAWKLILLLHWAILNIYSSTKCRVIVNVLLHSLFVCSLLLFLIYAYYFFCNSALWRSGARLVACIVLSHNPPLLCLRCSPTVICHQRAGKLKIRLKQLTFLSFLSRKNWNTGDERPRSSAGTCRHRDHAWFTETNMYRGYTSFIVTEHQYWHLCTNG